MSGGIEIPGGAYWRCPQHGRLKQVGTTFREQQTSYGPIVVMSAVAAWDEYPDLLACGMPCFTEEEIPALRGLTEPQRLLAMARRVKAQDDEWALRQQQPKRTVWG